MEINSALHYADISKTSQEGLCLREAKATFKQRAVEWPFDCHQLQPGTCLTCTRRGGQLRFCWEL